MELGRTPIMKYWEKVKPQRGARYRYVSPYFIPALEIDYNRRGPHVVNQAALTPLEILSGFPKLLKPPSDRTWFPTYVRQLLFCLEGRPALGHWDEGSEMPNLYVMAVCATELNLRNKILSETHPGWTPAHAFEAPNAEGVRKDPNPPPAALRNPRCGYDVRNVYRVVR